MPDFVTQVGECFVGSGAEAAHVNTVLGRKGDPVESAFVTALATPSQGHVPFLAVLQPGLPVKPFTLFVNKAAIASERHATLTWGAAQAGVAQGVAEAVAKDVIRGAHADGLLLVAAVWVDPAADDEEAVFANNAKATFGALAAGVERAPALDRVLAARNEPFNPFFRAR